MTDLKSLVRTIPDYPKPGIMFRDVTSLMADPAGFRATIQKMTEPYFDANVQAVAGIEARGFIFGGAIADKLNVAFIPVRKKGKLPGNTIGQDYELEYGTDTIEIHDDAVREGERILIVDDLIATGGTAEATILLLRQCKAEIVGASFVIDLPDLGGCQKIEKMGVPCNALMEFEGD